MSRQHLRRIRTALLLSLFTALLATSCGGEDDTATTDGASTPSDPVITPAPPNSDPDVTPDTPPAEPGVPIEWFVNEGDVLAVVGVAFDDTLNIRVRPGTDQEVVATTAPISNLVATGKARSLTESIWYEVEADSTTGWVNSNFVAYLGRQVTATRTFTGVESGLNLEADSPAELGRMVAELVATVDPPARIVMSAAPTSSQVEANVTYDVVNIGDDAILGYRLEVWAKEPPGRPWSIREVEQTALCARGLSAQRECL